uniref:Transposase Tc1-like domain-containing protein n=1 Tax=Cyprinus carpio carpio TaxID=630221 RepID=A0A9J7WYS1_CYPCA
MRNKIVLKEPRTTSKELQASLASIKVSVHDSTIRKRLGENGIHGRVPRQKKPLLSKKNIAAHLQFAKDHVDKPEEYWRNVLWMGETKIEHFGLNEQRYIWRKKTLHSSIRTLSHL